MQPPSRRVQGMRRSGIREIMDLAAGRDDVVHLELGQPCFDTPGHIVEAAHKAAVEGFTRYTPNAGLPSLRELIAAKLTSVNDLEVSADSVVVTTGAVGGLATTLMAILDPGEEVLIPDPGWPNVEMMLVCAGCVAKHYPLSRGNNFAPDIEVLATLVTPETKAIVINSPSNPTGAVFSEETVEGLVDFAVRHDLYLIADEVYEQIIFDGRHYSPKRFDLDGRVVGVHSFSKTYAMTGWRVGYVVASPPLTGLITKLQEAYFACASSVSQKAAEAALAAPQDCVDGMRQDYRRNRDLAEVLLSEAGLSFVHAQGTFYSLVDVSRSGLDSYEFAKRLLREAGVAVAPGRTFGPTGEGYVRLSLASAPAEIREGVNRLARFLSDGRGDVSRDSR